MALRWVLATAAALVAGAAWCPPAGAIVGGTEVAITQHPYQVALVNADKPAADRDGQYCGGSVRDAWHVITASHCVYNALGTGQGRTAADVDVLAGTNNLRDEAGHRFGVSKISYMPYDPSSFANDAALLTLSEPLPIGATIQSIPLIEEDWAGIDEPNSGEPLYVTGWGVTQVGGSATTVLHGVDVDYVNDHDCKANSDYLFLNKPTLDVEICAAKAGKDACSGDSGGPLVHAGPSPVTDDRLVGIVSSGTGCADPRYPGLYTEVGAPAIRAFLLQPDPPAAPAPTSAPVLSGSAAIGQRLTCNPGTWTGGPSFAYQFVRSVGSVDVGVAASGSSDYVVGAQDAGASLRCVVTATNPGGTSTAESARTGVVPGPVQPQPQPQAPQQSQNLDVYAPVARVTKTKCTSTRCTLSVSVRDAGFSAGIKTVRATVRSTYKSTCRRKGKKVSCTKTKSGKTSVKALGGTRFQVVASKLPIGKQLFTLIAVDKAGHQQALPTKKTATTKKPKKKSASRR